MYEIDPRFLNKDGSFKVEEAMEAGRQARTEAAYEGCRVVREGAMQLYRNVRRVASNALVSSSSGKFAGKSAA